jgi:peptide deformylase
MILPILTYPDPVLKKKSEEIKDPNDPKIRELILDMVDTLNNTSEGLALAAPQVGQSVRIFVMRWNRETYIFINPKIKSKSFRKELMEEGCLSFPGEFFPVKRHKKVTVEAMDRKGREVEIEAEGVMSQALQHEIDHLDGILFIDRK